MKAAAFCVAALLVAAPLAFAESMDDKNTDIAAAPSTDTPKNLQYLVRFGSLNVEGALLRTPTLG